MSRLLNILAAILSVSIFGVLVWWGLTLSQLDPNDIPVVKKANGPARISPKEPGGKQADHQGLSVSEVQTSDGISKLVDKVYLAPKPRPLQAEDIAGLDTQKEPEKNIKTGQAPILKDNKINSIIEPTVAQIKTKSDLAGSENHLINGDKFVPKIRPKNLELILNNNILNQATVQLGSFNIDVAASVQLENLKRTHSDILSNKDLFIEKVDDNLEIKYIIKVRKFEDADDMESFCMILKKRNTFCAPVNPR